MLPASRDQLRDFLCVEVEVRWPADKWSPARNFDAAADHEGRLRAGPVVDPAHELLEADLPPRHEPKFAQLSVGNLRAGLMIPQSPAHQGWNLVDMPNSPSGPGPRPDEKHSPSSVPRGDDVVLSKGCTP